MGEEGSALTTRQYSDRTGLSLSAISKLIRQGKLEGYKRAGKWLIPANQLQSPSPAASLPQTEPAQPITAPNESDYSVIEFSRMTYLTEFGVMEWLKKGKLNGRRQADGCWRVNASNLGLPGLKHLLRKKIQ